MEFLSIGSSQYFAFFALLVVSRGLDFLSTWIATPNLILEANPIARKLGWKWGLAVNGILCMVFAAWPLPAVIVATTSFLVAARNLQSAWLMRNLGEEGYRQWMAERLSETPFVLYAGCITVHALIYGVLGVGLMVMAFEQWTIVAIGMGLLTYALAVVFYSLVSAWRLRRHWTEDKTM